MNVSSDPRLGGKQLFARRDGELRGSKWKMPAKGTETQETSIIASAVDWQDIE